MAPIDASEPPHPSDVRPVVSSLANRLAAIVFALVAVVSFLVAFELSRREEAHGTESKQLAAEMLTQLFAASIVPALDFADTEALTTSLDLLAQNREVIDARVWSPNAMPLAEFTHRPPFQLASARPPLGCHRATDHIDIVREAVNPLGKSVGTVAIRVSLAREQSAFVATRTNIFWLAFALTGLVTALIVVVLSKSIFSPLAELERAARRLARGELTEVNARQQDEVGALAATFNQMGRAIKDRERCISTMNTRLQSLLDNMRQAIILFNLDGSLCSVDSKLARQFFADAERANSNIVDLLYPNQAASAIERQAFEIWLNEVAGASSESFDELADLAPNEVIHCNSHTPDRVLELEFRSVLDDDGIQRLMLLATDVTAHRILKQTAEARERDHQNQLAAMRRILAGGGQIFVTFLASARSRITQASRELRTALPWPRDTTERIFQCVHTLRAEARSFSLKEVENLSSRLELELAGSRHAPEDSTLHQAVQSNLDVGLAALADELDRAEALFVESSPIGRRVLSQVTVSREDLEALISSVDSREDQIGQLAARLLWRPFGELLSGLPESVLSWASRDGKRVELGISGREVLVPPRLFALLGGALAHLLRNAIAHGIECPAERIAAGKPEQGRIEIDCQQSTAGVIVEVRDDGAGFDVEALSRRAGSQAELATIELAFLSGISTRDAPDELAGYGVGLGAVRDELRQVAYAVVIQTSPGRGTRVQLLPAAPLGDSAHA